MAKYKAKVDTVFNFTFIRAGKIIVAGEELRNSPNFECLDGSSKKAAGTGSTTGGNAEYAKALQRGKELGIPMYNRIPKEGLFAAIAKAEAERAAPKSGNDKGNAGTGDSGTGETDNKNTGETENNENDGNNAGGENIGDTGNK